MYIEIGGNPATMPLSMATARCNPSQFKPVHHGLLVKEGPMSADILSLIRRRRRLCRSCATVHPPPRSSGSALGAHISNTRSGGYRRQLHAASRGGSRNHTTGMAWLVHSPASASPKVLGFCRVSGRACHTCGLDLQAPVGRTILFTMSVSGRASAN